MTWAEKHPLQQVIQIGGDGNGVAYSFIAGTAGITIDVVGTQVTISLTSELSPGTPDGVVEWTDDVFEAWGTGEYTEWG